MSDTAKSESKSKGGSGATGWILLIGSAVVVGSIMGGHAYSQGGVAHTLDGLPGSAPAAAVAGR